MRGPGGRLTKIESTARPDHGPEVWTKIGRAAQNRGNQGWAKEKPKLDNAPRLRWICFIDPWWPRIQGNFSKYKNEFGKALWHLPCLVKELQTPPQICFHSRTLHPQTDCGLKSVITWQWNHMNHKATRGIFSTQKIMKSTLQAKDMLQWHIIIWGSSLLRCSKRWKFWMRKQQWINNVKSTTRSQHDNWRKSRERRRSTWKHKETKRNSTLPHWWQEWGVRTQIAKV